LVVHFWAFSPKAARIVCLPMPPIVIDIRNAEDARDVVHRAVQALAEGQLVALPTETVYGLAASACRPDAVERLLTAEIFELRYTDIDWAIDRLETLVRKGR